MTKHHSFILGAIVMLVTCLAALWLAFAYIIPMLTAARM